MVQRSRGSLKRYSIGWCGAVSVLSLIPVCYARVVVCSGLVVSSKLPGAPVMSSHRLEAVLAGAHWVLAVFSGRSPMCQRSGMLDRL
jgi:hypothetical protein